MFAALRRRSDDLETLPCCGALAGISRMFTGRLEVSFCRIFGPVSGMLGIFQGRMGANGGGIPAELDDKSMRWRLFDFAGSVVCGHFLAIA